MRKVNLAVYKITIGKSGSGHHENMKKMKLFLGKLVYSKGNGVGLRGILSTFQCCILDFCGDTAKDYT